MPKLLPAVLLLTVTGFGLTPQSAPPADLVLLSGNILTVDDRFTVATAR